jgi:hypothetical protein
MPLVKFTVELAVFGTAAVALYVTGHHVLAVAFAVLVVVNSLLVRL